MDSNNHKNNLCTLYFCVMLWHVQHYFLRLYAYILVWPLSMTLYGSLDIVCQYVYEHYIMCVRQLVSGDPTSFSFNLCIACLVMTRGLGAYCPQYMLIIFMYTGFWSVRYVLQIMWAYEPKLHTYIYFTVYVHYIL